MLQKVTGLLMCNACFLSAHSALSANGWLASSCVSRVSVVTSRLRTCSGCNQRLQPMITSGLVAAATNDLKLTLHLLPPLGLQLDPSATPIHEVEDISSLTADTSTAGTQWGTGGMVTKLTAARIATAAGCCLVICTSLKPEGILEILDGAKQGTKFFPLQNALKGRKRWLLAGKARLERTDFSMFVSYAQGIKSGVSNPQGLESHFRSAGSSLALRAASLAGVVSLVVHLEQGCLF